MVPQFRKAIYDALKEAHKDGVYIPSTAALRSAAFAAMKELLASEVEAVEPLLAVNVWNAVMLTNESAFHQTMAREIENGTLAGITIRKGAKSVARTYME